MTASNHLSSSLTTMIRSSPPVRAITSTLVNRSSPSLPPSTTTYEPAVKSVLRQRLSRAFLQSALLCWAVSSVWVVGGGWLAPFMPSTLLASALLWISAVVPVTVLRKVYLTPARTPASSPKSSFKAAIAKPSTKPALVFYLLSSLSLAALYATTDPRLTLFARSKKHPQYLNGRLLFVLASQFVVALAFLFRNLLRDRFSFRWVNMSSGSPSILLIIPHALVGAFFSVIGTLPIACLVFGFARTVIIPILYAIPGLPIFLRPFTAHFLRGSYTFMLPFNHIPLLTKAWWLGFCTFFLWETADSMFDGIVSEPVSLPAPTTTVIVSGVRSKDPIMQYYAYADLSQLITDSNRRQEIFGEATGVNMWGVLAREALLLLGKDYQKLLGRGVVATPPPPPPPATPKKAPETPIGTPIPLLRQSILRSQVDKSNELVLDTIGSDGPLEKVVEQAAHVPELFRSVNGLPAVAKKAIERVPEPTSSGAGIVAQVKSQVYKRVHDLISSYSPAWLLQAQEGLAEWWSTERKSRTVDVAWAGMREVDIVVIDGAYFSICVCVVLTGTQF